MADVFYSISPFGTGDIKVACNISVTSGVATFSVAQTGNIGIGCHVISSGVDGFISVMTNSTTATLITALGASHGDVSSETLTSIAHEYASLSAFEAGYTDANHTNNVNLVTATIAAKAICYYDHDDSTEDTTSVVIDGTTMDATYDLVVKTPTGGTESINDQRHAGVLDTSKYSLFVTFTPLSVSDTHVTVEGLQIGHSNTGNSRNVCRVVTVPGGVINAFSNIFHAPGTAGATSCNGIDLTTIASAATSNIRNNIIYDIGGGSNSSGIKVTDGDWIANVDNNTIINCYYGVNLSTGTHANKIFRNNIAQDCTDGFRTSGGSWETGTDYNLSDIASDAPGASSVESTLTFNDKTGDDFHLASGDTDAIGAGTDLSGTFTDDIDGDTRSAWDIGADEFISVGGGLPAGSLSLLGVGV